MEYRCVTTSASPNGARGPRWYWWCSVTAILLVAVVHGPNGSDAAPVLDDANAISRGHHRQDRIKERSASLVAPWFGPRLGRRKRNPNGLGGSGGSDEIYRGVTSALEPRQRLAIIELPGDSPVAFIALKETKRQNSADFTPRLGRESGEDLVLDANGSVDEQLFVLPPQALPSTSMLYAGAGLGGGVNEHFLVQDASSPAAAAMMESLVEQQILQRSPPFAPRLGRRRLLPFSPRLGRRPQHQLDGSNGGAVGAIAPATADNMVGL